MNVEDIRTLAQIANDKRLDAETRKSAHDIFDKLYYLQYMTSVGGHKRARASMFAAVETEHGKS